MTCLCATPYFLVQLASSSRERQTQADQIAHSPWQAGQTPSFRNYGECPPAHSVDKSLRIPWCPPRCIVSNPMRCWSLLLGKASYCTLRSTACSRTRVFEASVTSSKTQALATCSTLCSEITHVKLDGPSLHLFPSARQSPPTSEALDPRRAGERARPRLQSILNVCLFGVKSYCQTRTRIIAQTQRYQFAVVEVVTVALRFGT